MKKLILATDRLNNLDTELIGDGGQSRLDIMLDLSTGEVWADVFYDHEANSWTEYDDKNVICVGRARNAILVDDETGEADPDGRCWWTVGIDAPNGNPDDTIYLSGDYYNDYYDVDVVLDVISMLYGKEE